MFWEVLRQNVYFVCFFLGRKNISVGRAGIDPLTVRYINVSLWSRRLLSNVSRLWLVSMVVIDPRCLEQQSPGMKRAARCWIFSILSMSPRWYGSYTMALYSTTARTRAMHAVRLLLDGHLRIVRLRNQVCYLHFWLL